jgi:hypothetical protein
MTTNAFPAGSSAVVTFVITNSSANTITAATSASILDSGVVLTNDAGDFYNLTKLEMKSEF